MYTYGVEAVDAWGHHSDRVSATASTPPPPPVDQARLEGDFAVKATFVSENYQNFSVGQVEKLTFSFTPQCADGPCQVRVDLFAPHESLSMLAKHGARYEGALTALTDKCGSTELPSHLDIDVWVTKASYIQGAWRATAFGGMLGHSSSAKRGCQAGISRQTLAGTLQK